MQPLVHTRAWPWMHSLQRCMHCEQQYGSYGMILVLLVAHVV